MKTKRCADCKDFEGEGGSKMYPCNICFEIAMGAKSYWQKKKIKSIIYLDEMEEIMDELDKCGIEINKMSKELKKSIEKIKKVFKNSKGGK